MFQSVSSTMASSAAPAACQICPLKVSLDINAARIGRTVVDLSPKGAELLHVLTEAYPNYVHRDKLYASLYGINQMPDSETIKFHVWSLNKRFKETRVEIESKYGRGWRLVLR